MRVIAVAALATALLITGLFSRCARPARPPPGAGGGGLPPPGVLSRVGVKLLPGQQTPAAFCFWVFF